MKLLISVVKKHPLTILAGVAIAVSLLGINEWGYQDSLKQLQAQDKLRELQGTTVELSNSLQALEAAHHSYLITAHDTFYQRYQKERQTAQLKLSVFQAHAKSSPYKVEMLELIPSLVEARLSNIDQNVDFKKSGNNQALGAQDQLLAASHQSTADLVEMLSNVRIANRKQASILQEDVRAALHFSRIGLLLTVLMAFVAFLAQMRQRLNMQHRAETYAQSLQNERNHLEQQVIVRTANLRELATNLQMTSEQTRSRLARELHDELGSLLTATKLHIARIKSRVSPDDTVMLNQVASLNDTLNQVIAIKRRIIEDLRPSSLENFGLLTSLEILQSEFHERTGIPIESTLDEVELPSHGQLAFYRIVQESLNNITKYANATKVDLHLTSYPQHIELSITDNGVGFDQDVVKPKSHGLAGMRHRVESLRGRLEVSSAPGQGTTVRAVVPQMHADTMIADPES